MILKTKTNERTEKLQCLGRFYCVDADDLANFYVDAGKKSRVSRMSCRSKTSERSWKSASGDTLPPRLSLVLVKACSLLLYSLMLACVYAVCLFCL